MQKTDNIGAITLSSLNKYISIARPDHWAKHVFMIPGAALAYLLGGAPDQNILLAICLGVPSACFIASANYVINEWLDAEFDKFHPIKKYRPAASEDLDPRIVYLEYFLLVSSGLFLAWNVCTSFFVTSVIFAIMGVLYNVKPFRTKDSAYLDVLSESVNNPLRLMLGWSIVSMTTIPPLSLFVFYWFGGAFLMAAKRLAEYRYITKTDSLDNLINYRRSFKTYTENSLLVSSFLYAILSSFFIATFLVKYRTEYLIIYPMFAVLFAYYLNLSMKDTSVAQTPEKLHKDKGLMGIVCILVGLFVILTFVDIPVIQTLVGSKEIVIKDILN